MRTLHGPSAGFVRCGLLAALLLAASVPLGATPRVPISDAIVETLPTLAGWSLEARRLRQALAEHPRDAASAITAAPGLPGTGANAG